MTSKNEGPTSYPYKPLSTKKDRRSLGRIVRDNGEPKNPHEEIMNCVESTNAIASKILDLLETERNAAKKLLRTMEEMIRKNDSL